MKKRDEKDMNYESNITIIRREYNEERVSKNLRARIEFFKTNKRATTKVISEYSNYQINSSRSHFSPLKNCSDQAFG